VCGRNDLLALMFSKLPVLGVAVPYARGNALLTMLGQIIVALTSAGWGMEAPLKVSMS
jgi:hypothetical protein